MALVATCSTDATQCNDVGNVGGHCGNPVMPRYYKKSQNQLSSLSMPRHYSDFS